MAQIACGSLRETGGSALMGLGFRDRNGIGLRMRIRRA